MTRKQLFWRILLLLLLFTLIINWKDVKNGIMDGINDSWNIGNSTSIKK